MKHYVFGFLAAALLSLASCGDKVTFNSCPQGYTEDEAGECVADDTGSQGNVVCGATVQVTVLVTDGTSNLALDVEELSIVDGGETPTRLVAEKPLGYPVGSYVIQGGTLCRIYYGSVTAPCYKPYNMVQFRLNADLLSFSMERVEDYDNCILLESLGS